MIDDRIATRSTASPLSWPVWSAAAVVFGLAFATRSFFLFAPGFPIDQSQFLVWSDQARSGGLDGVYETRRPDGRRYCNYPPAYLYVLWWMAGVYERLAPEDGGALGDAAADLLYGVDSPSARLAGWLYKLPAVTADALLAAALVVWLSRRLGAAGARPLAIAEGTPRAAVVVGVGYALMPAAIHNSAVWGQVDAIPTLLMAASLERLRQRRIPAMTALATLAVLTKAQAAILAPIWVVAAFRWAGRQGRRWLALIGIVVVLTAALVAPFLSEAGGVWDAYASAAGYYPYTHLNGFSIWFFSRPLNAPQLAGNLDQHYQRDDRPGLFGLTPRTAGLAAVWVVWATVVVRWWRRDEEAVLRWAARLLPLVFFFLATQMHERYLFPAIALWAWAYEPTRRWWVLWLLLGAAAAANALWVWPGPGSGAVVAGLRDWLHRPWFGLSSGLYWATAVAALFFLSLPAPPSAEAREADEG